MDQQHQKFVNISYILFAALIGYLAFAGMMKVSGTFDLESKVKSIEYIIRTGSVVLGFLIFAVLYRNTTANTFMGDVAVELLTKVTWPTIKETQVATGVVFVTVIIASLILGFFDWIWALAIKAIL
jgi:preprotein translocase SecE subunit